MVFWIIAYFYNFQIHLQEADLFSKEKKCLSHNWLNGSFKNLKNSRNKYILTKNCTQILNLPFNKLIDTDFKMIINYKVHQKKWVCVHSLLLLLFFSSKKTTFYLATSSLRKKLPFFYYSFDKLPTWLLFLTFITHEVFGY